MEDEKRKKTQKGGGGGENGGIKSECVTRSYRQGGRDKN